MHMDDPRRTRPLVEIVNVLRHQRQASAARRQRRFQPGERGVSGVGFRVQEVAPAQIIEFEHRVGIAREAFRRRELHRIEARPDALALLVAKRAKPALGRDPGASQNEDVIWHASS